MIFLCPKAFAGRNSAFEREFLMFYLSQCGDKAVIANEVWEAFRFRVKQRATDPTKVDDIIAAFRGNFQPENSKLTAEFEEEEPTRITLKQNL